MFSDWRDAYETTILPAFNAWQLSLGKAAFQQAVFPPVADGTPDLSDHLARGRDQAADQACILAVTARIVSVHVAHNQVRCSELPGLIQEVCKALVRVSASGSSLRGLVPAVPINRSVFPDYIVCLENGRRFRTMRRHLMAAFGLTPEQYRK